MKTEIRKIEDCEWEISGEIPADKFESFRKNAVQRLGANVKIDGFRSGHIPESVLCKHFGENIILEEMAEMAIGSAYPEIISEHKLNAIGYPQISLTKVATNNPLGFKMTISVMPEFKLADYKEIAGKVMSEKGEVVEASEKEVNDVLLQLQKMRTKEGTESPKIDDEFAKSLGKFNNLSDLKEKVGKNIELEKEIKERDKRRVKIIESIVEKSDIPLPRIMVEREKEKMISEIKHEIEHAGMDFKDYLTRIKKTEGDIRGELKSGAEKRVRFELVLGKIAQDEKLEVPKEDIARETEQLMKIYEGADPERAGLYVEGQLINERVFRFLESIK